MKKLFLFCLIGFSSLPLLANAQIKDQAETTILADTLSYDDLQKVSEFKGNVTVTRGFMRLQADVVKVTEDAQGNQHAKASMTSKQQVSVYEERPERYETIQAKGNTAQYHGASQEVRLQGKAMVVRQVCGQVVDTLYGDSIIYNSKNNTYSAQSQKNNRVRSVIKARSQADKAFKNCQQRYQGKPMPSLIQKG